MNIVSLPTSSKNIYFEVPSIKRVLKRTKSKRNFESGKFK